jgi:hypothetical protein
MQYAPKQFVITPPKSINMSQHQFLNTKYNIQNSQPQHAVTQFIPHNIQYSILQNIIDKINILKSTQIIQNRYIQHTVGSDLEKKHIYFAIV